MNNYLEILLNGQQFKKLYERKFHPISEKYGLTMLEIKILIFLDNNKKYDTAKDIVDLELFAKSHVSTAIASLMSSGYVVGKPDEIDRRCIHLKVSDKAREAIMEANEMREDLIDVLYQSITLEEKSIVDSVAKRIANNIKMALENDE